MNMQAHAMRVKREVACVQDGGHWFTDHTPSAVFCRRCGTKQLWEPISALELSQEVDHAIDAYQKATTEPDKIRALVRLRFGTEALLGALHGRVCEVTVTSDGPRYRIG